MLASAASRPCRALLSVPYLAKPSKTLSWARAVSDLYLLLFVSSMTAPVATCVGNSRVSPPTVVIGYVPNSVWATS